MESVVEQEPDWADAVLSRSTEAAASQPNALPTDEPNGNEAVAASRHFVARIEFNKLLNVSEDQRHHTNVPLQFTRAVCNHWTGLVDWTTGLDYWTDV